MATFTWTPMIVALVALLALRFLGHAHRAGYKHYGSVDRRRYSR